MSSLVEGPRELCGILFRKALIPFTRTPPSWPKHLQRPHLLIPSCLGIRISMYEFQKDTFRPSDQICHSVMSDSLRPHESQHARPPCPWDSPGKNTGVGCHALLQGIFATQGYNPGLPHCRRILYHLSHQGSPLIVVILLLLLLLLFKPL